MLESGKVHIYHRGLGNSFGNEIFGVDSTILARDLRDFTLVPEAGSDDLGYLKVEAVSTSLSGPPLENLMAHIIVVEV